MPLYLENSKTISSSFPVIITVSRNVLIKVKPFRPLKVICLSESGQIWQETSGKVHISKYCLNFYLMIPNAFLPFSQQWILDKQDLTRERQHDLAILTEEEYQKIFIFFASGNLGLFDYILSFNSVFLCL